MFLSFIYPLDCLTETWLSGILFKILGKKDKKKYKKRIKRIISKTLTFTLKPKHNATLHLVPPFLLSFIIYSEIEGKTQKAKGKKDNFKDKKRIKRIILTPHFFRHGKSQQTPTKLNTFPIA